MRSAHLSRIALLMLLAPVALLWGEGFTRALLPQNVDTVLDILVPDAELGYIYEPGALRHERGREYDVPFNINSFGLRDRERDTDKNGCIRVLLVGDSFSVSHGESLQHSLPAQVERALTAELARTDPTRRVEVINAANAGYTPYHYWKSYRRWGPIFHPDLVLVGLFTGNDYVSEDPEVRFLIRDGLVAARYREGEQPRPRRKSALFKLRKILARNSQFYVLLRNYFYYNETVERLLGRQGGTEGVTLEQLQPFLDPEPERVSQGWRKTADYLARLKQDCQEDGVAVAVLRIPVKMEVDEERRSQMRTRAEGQGASLDLEQPARRVAALCLELNLPLVDPLASIRQLHEREPAYFSFDDHWNRAGIEAAAQDVAARFRAQGLPPFIR
jgi:hypothetical protein